MSRCASFLKGISPVCMYPFRTHSLASRCPSHLPQDLLEAEDFKFLIFAHHKCLIEGIEQQCVKSKVGPER